MGIKYSKLVELVKEQEAKQKNHSPPKTHPQRPNLGEKKEEKI